MSELAVPAIPNCLKTALMSNSNFPQTCHCNFFICHFLSNRRNLTSWERFHIGIRKYALYDPEEGTADDLIRDLVNQEIIDVGKYNLQLTNLLLLSDSLILAERHHFTSHPGVT